MNPACPIRLVDDADEGRVVYFFADPLPEGGHARRVSLHVGADGEVTRLAVVRGDPNIVCDDVTTRDVAGLLREIADFLDGNAPAASEEATGAKTRTTEAGRGESGTRVARAETAYPESAISSTPSED